MKVIKKYLNEGMAVSVEYVENKGFKFVEAFKREDIERYLNEKCKAGEQELCVLASVKDFDDEGDGVALFLPCDCKEKRRKYERSFCHINPKIGYAFLKEFSDIDIGISRIELVNRNSEEKTLIGFITNGIEPVFDFLKTKEDVSINVSDFEVNLKLNEDTIDILIAQALSKTSLSDFYSYVSERVIGQEKAVRLGCYAIYNYFRSIANGDVKHINMLMIGPSGCGKTEFIRAVCDFIREHKIPIPIDRFDMTQITANGYKGDDSHAILDGLLAENRDLHGYGIAVIDEFDKRIRPSLDSHGNDQNAECQCQILTMIEGNVFKLEDGRFDSNKTMFICIGSFQDIRDARVSEKTSRKSGFLQSAEANAGEAFYEEFSIEDLVEYGMKEELAGRFNFTTYFGRIEREMMEKIIIKRTKEIEEELDLEITLSKRSIDDIYNMSYGPCGVRTPINHIRQLCYELMAEKTLADGIANQRVKLYVENKDTVKLINKEKDF